MPIKQTVRHEEQKKIYPMWPHEKTGQSMTSPIQEFEKAKYVNADVTLS